MNDYVENYKKTYYGVGPYDTKPKDRVIIKKFITHLPKSFNSKLKNKYSVEAMRNSKTLSRLSEYKNIGIYLNQPKTESEVFRKTSSSFVTNFGLKSNQKYIYD